MMLRDLSSSNPAVQPRGLAPNPKGLQWLGPAQHCWSIYTLTCACCLFPSYPPIGSETTPYWETTPGPPSSLTTPFFMRPILPQTSKQVSKSSQSRMWEHKSSTAPPLLSGQRSNQHSTTPYISITPNDIYVTKQGYRSDT